MVCPLTFPSTQNLHITVIQFKDASFTISKQEKPPIWRRQPMKKLLKTLLVLAVLGAASYCGYTCYQANYATTTQAATENAYTEYTIARGALSKTVTGTGTLSISQTEDVALKYGVTVTEVLAEAGDTVAEGDALMHIDTAALQTTIDTMQTELATTESEIAALTDSMSSTVYVKMPLYGRVKEVYISAGQYIQDVMEEKGCIALLSLDGWMYAEIPAVEGMEISSVLKVKVGRTLLDGTVRSLDNGVATVTFSDAYGTEGGEVTLTYHGEELGTATAHIHLPYQLTTTEKGYIHSVYLENDARKWEGNRVCYLINVPVSDSYTTLCATREAQSAQLKEMRALFRAGEICAPQGGIVASVVTASATEQEAYTTLASLYVGDEKEMVVSVDELDIISLQVGQNVSIAMDAISDQTYAAKVSKVSQIGSASSGVTLYNVTLTIDGDEKLKLGMNGTATIQIEERADVLLVPIAALNTSRGASYVWLRSSDAGDEPGVRTQVETGLSDENYAEIVSGLSEGDVVLITRQASATTTTRNESGAGMDFGAITDMAGGMMPGGGTAPSGGGNSNRGTGGGRPAN